MDKVLTIYDVRLRINTIYTILQTVNSHIHDNTVCAGDYDALKVAFDNCRELKSSKWTYHLL